MAPPAPTSYRDGRPGPRGDYRESLQDRECDEPAPKKQRTSPATRTGGKRGADHCGGREEKWPRAA